MKATETETSPRRRWNCESTAKDGVESEKGLKEINGGEREIACFVEGESGRSKYWNVVEAIVESLFLFYFFIFLILSLSFSALFVIWFFIYFWLYMRQLIQLIFYPHFVLSSRFKVLISLCGFLYYNVFFLIFIFNTQFTWFPIFPSQLISFCLLNFENVLNLPLNFEEALQISVNFRIFNLWESKEHLNLKNVIQLDGYLVKSLTKVDLLIWVVDTSIIKLNIITLQIRT